MTASGLVALWLLAAGPGSAPVVMGHARAEYAAPEGLLYPSYENAGFRQEAGSGWVAVEVELKGEFARAPFLAARAGGIAARTAPEPEAGPDVQGFALEAARGARTLEAAVTQVLEAVAAAVRYDRDAIGTESPVEALAAGRSYCVGLANLSVAALEALGIEARVVHGLLVDASGVARGHRWIEVHYPDTGWVFTDPTASINFVSTDHLLLRVPGTAEAGYDPAPFVIAGPARQRRSGALLVVDRAPEGRLGRRRNRALQSSPTIAGRVRGGAPGAAVRLEGAGRALKTALDRDGAFSFSELEPGRYHLSLAPPAALNHVVDLAPYDLELVELRVGEDSKP